MMNLMLKRNLLGAVLIALALYGCGGGGGGTGDSSITPGSGSPAASSSVTLNWEAPGTRVDGTAMAIEDIAGYKLHYGSSSGSYTGSIDVGNSNSYTMEDLPAGTYYFAVTAYDLNGNESAYSPEVSGTI